MAVQLTWANQVTSMDVSAEIVSCETHTHKVNDSVQWKT